MWIDSFSYKADEGKKYFDVADGDHRVRLDKAEPCTSKGGKRMIALTLAVEGEPNNLPYIHFIVEGEYFDTGVSRVFDAFKIPVGNFNFPSWVGKYARAHFEHKEETYIDKQGFERKIQKAKLTYFHNNLEEGKAEQLPPQVQQVQQTFNTTPIF